MCILVRSIYKSKLLFEAPFRELLPLLRNVVPLNVKTCRLTMPVVKGRCPRDALPHIFDIGVFKCGKAILPLKHIYNESDNVINSCDFAFDSNTRWNRL